MFNKLWGKPGSTTSMNHYQKMSKSPKMSKKIKNFYACNTFIRHVINVYIIVFIMKKLDFKNNTNFSYRLLNLIALLVLNGLKTVSEAVLYLTNSSSNYTKIWDC